MYIGRDKNRYKIITHFHLEESPSCFGCLEVYAALSSALQQLFGAAEFTEERLKEQYKSQPELAAYLIARRAMSLRDPERSEGLREVESLLRRFTVPRAARFGAVSEPLR